MRIFNLPLNIWPIAQRELREGARRPINHRLRLLTVAAGTGMIWIALGQENEFSSPTGTQLFAVLHSCILGLICLIVPALAADSLAREKRERTLGLLFLTPLNAGGIVAGKGLVQALRAFTLWLAVIPVLAIPFLLGGITAFDAVSALSIEFCAAALSLAAGLLASSLVEDRTWAFVLGWGLGCLFVLSFFYAFDFVTYAWLDRAHAIVLGWDWAPADMIAMYCGQYRGLEGCLWNSTTLLSPPFRQIWILICSISPVVVVVIFSLIASFAALRIKMSWRDTPPSSKSEERRQRFCGVILKRLFQRRMRRILDRNPIAWLQQYSWKARASKWGLCLAFLITGAAVLTLYQGDLEGLGNALNWMLIILAAGYTFAGVNGFLEEKRNGALELILVTPLTANRLIMGRTWGLWKQFMPAAVIIALLISILRHDHLSMSGAYDTSSSFTVVEWELLCGFLALPVFATYFALRVKNLIVASVLTWIALSLPVILVQEVASLVETSERELSASSLAVGLIITYAISIWLACFLLRHSLSRRLYAF